MGYQKKEILEKLKEMKNNYDEEQNDEENFEEEAIQELDDEILGSEQG